MHLTSARQKILDTIRATGKNPDAITILAVTKKRSVADIQAVLDAGFTVIGENRVQEAAEKFSQLPPCERHLIGHLQKNKVRKAVQLFDCIQSLDSVALAEAIDRVCNEESKIMPVFLEVNIANDPAKFGFTTEAVTHAATHLNTLKNIRIEGLMTIGKLGASPDETRHYFRALRVLFDNLKGTTFPHLRHCSMGMSSDFQIAVEEGATMIRIGSFLFQ